MTSLVSGVAPSSSIALILHDRFEDSSSERGAGATNSWVCERGYGRWLRLCCSSTCRRWRASGTGGVGLRGVSQQRRVQWRRKRCRKKEYVHCAPRALRVPPLRDACASSRLLSYGMRPATQRYGLHPRARVLQPGCHGHTDHQCAPLPLSYTTNPDITLCKPRSRLRFSVVGSSLMQCSPVLPPHAPAGL